MDRKRAARSLIKAGHPRSFQLFGFVEKIAVKLSALSITPATIRIGDELTLEFCLKSIAPQPQKIAVDYIVHYQKKSGKLSAKVFKLKEVILAAGAVLAFKKRQRMVDFSTRKHYPGHHEVEIMVNGTVLAKRSFTLTR